MGGIGKFLPIGRYECDTAINAVVTAFRVDHDRLAAFVCGVDHGADYTRRECTLGIVGKNPRPPVALPSSRAQSKHLRCQDRPLMQSPIRPQQMC